MVVLERARVDHRRKVLGEHNIRRIRLCRRFLVRLVGKFHVIEDRVFDQEMLLLFNTLLQRIIPEVRANRNHGVCGLQATVFKELESTNYEFRFRETEVFKLLRQARMHVVDHPKAEDRF